MNPTYDEVDHLIRQAMHSRPEPRTPLDLAALALAKVERGDALAAARARRVARFRRYTRFATTAAVLLIAITAAAILRHNLPSASPVADVTQLAAQDATSFSASSSFSWVTPLLAATLTLAAAAFGLGRALGDDRTRMLAVPAFS